ncbi:MAG: peptidyl-prolyl cis-trans isomerase [Acidobacteriaceae bacterium]
MKSPSEAGPAQQPPSDAKASSVPADAAVITLDGVCDNPPAEKSASSNCKTVVTRAEFEDLINAAAPNIPPTARRQLATRYAMGLAMAQQAHAMGVDKGPKFDEMLKLARMQVAAQQLSQALQDKAAQMSDKDIEDYYKANPDAYQQVSLQRLFIPLSKQASASKVKLSQAQTASRKTAGDAAMKAEAEALHKRAAAGEDFSKLQAEAFVAAGYKTTPPSTEPEKVRRSALPPTQLSIMDLKPGEVSQVMSDASGYTIYKLKEKETLPVEGVREEIRATLKTQRLQQSMQALQQTATPTLNDEYFGPATAAGPQSRPGAGMQPAPPARQTLPSPK